MMAAAWERKKACAKKRLRWKQALLGGLSIENSNVFGVVIYKRFE